MKNRTKWTKLKSWTNMVKLTKMKKIDKIGPKFKNCLVRKNQRNKIAKIDNVLQLDKIEKLN